MLDDLAGLRPARGNERQQCTRHPLPCLGVIPGGGWPLSGLASREPPSAPADTHGELGVLFAVQL